MASGILPDLVGSGIWTVGEAGDGGTARPMSTVLVRGGREIASRALTFARLSPYVRPALVNGAAGVVVASEQRVFSVMAFTVAGGKVVAIDVLADPDRLRALDLPALDRCPSRRVT